METKTTLMEAKRCPLCHCPDTVARKGFEVAEVEPPTGAYIAIETKIIPLQQSALAGVSIKVLLAHWDICLKCGTQYYTKAEYTKIPVQMQPMRR